MKKLENKRTMTHPYKKPGATYPPLSRVAMIFGLLIFGSQVPVTQAQLGPCTPLQQEHGDTSCESPRESSKSLFDTMKGWFGFSSEEPEGEGVSRLEPLPKPSIKNDPYELDPIVKPSEPPINGVRDYLNRQDPAHAIYPLEPGTSALDKQ
jgi:hypothetical protein